MFCPKCGTQAIDGTKFCRGCGMDLSVVSAVLNGELTLSKSKKKLKQNGCGDDGDENSNDPDKLWNSFVTNGFIGLAFIIIALILTVTNVSRGGQWGFWMLIPGFACLGSGVASYFKAKRIERRRERQFNFAASNAGNLSSQRFASTALPPQQTVYADYYSTPARNTGELVEPPASVTEHTTRHLQQTGEGETINLPRK